MRESYQEIVERMKVLLAAPEAVLAKAICDRFRPAKNIKRQVPAKVLFLRGHLYVVLKDGRWTYGGGTDEVVPFANFKGLMMPRSLSTSSRSSRRSFRSTSGIREHLTALVELGVCPCEDADKIRRWLDDVVKAEDREFKIQNVRDDAERLGYDLIKKPEPA